MWSRMARGAGSVGKAGKGAELPLRERSALHRTHDDSDTSCASNFPSAHSNLHLTTAPTYPATYGTHVDAAMAINNDLTPMVPPEPSAKRSSAGSRPVAAPTACINSLRTSFHGMATCQCTHSS